MRAIRAAALLLCSCQGITMPDQSKFDLSNQVQQWKFSIDQNAVAVVEFRLGSTGNGLVESVPGKEWNFNPNGCLEPLHISGTASSGTNYSSISFTVNNRDSHCFWNVQGNASGYANLPKLTNASSAQGTMKFTYQDLHTPPQNVPPFSGNWTATRCVNDRC